jgi:predicted DNA-binding transcriptional regulator YafY
MSKKGYISRYLIILNKLRQQKYCSYEELAAYIRNQQELLRLGDESLDIGDSKRTIQRDIKEIRELFGIDIAYSRREKGYQLIQSDSENLNFQRRLEAFDMINSLNIKDDLNPIVKLENRQPSGTEHLYGIIHAVKNHFIIQFTYHKFWEDKLTERVCEPFFLKEFRNRWYVIAKDQNDLKTKTFALDRISDLDIIRTKFIPEEVSKIESKFSNAFGIIFSDTEQPEKVILSFTPFQGKYLKTLPLHHSQEILIDNEMELRVGLNLYITEDLIMELLSFGANMKVIAPQKLINKIVKAYRTAFESYGTE